MDILRNNMIKHENNSVTLTEKEYYRLVICILCNDRDSSEIEIFNWVNDDNNLSWDDDWCINND